MNRLIVHLTVAVALIVTLFGITLSSPQMADSSSPAAHVHIRHTQRWYADNVRGMNGPAENMTYHSGSVMQTLAVYTIYWSPSGYTPSIPSDYENLINRYLQDVGGSPYYSIASQYYQTPPLRNIQNVSTLAGTWTDTVNPYPHAGSTADPILDVDIENEVLRAITSNGWPNGGLNNTFLVFTAEGVESCVSSICTPGINPYLGYCAYHATFSTNGTSTIVYSNMPFVNTWPAECNGMTVSPNNDLAADSEISVVAHEQLESATDPLQNAWYDTSASGEIGDKCAYQYGFVGADGHNVILNGHPYIVQQQWSNAAFDGASYSGCALAYALPRSPIQLFLPYISR